MQRQYQGYANNQNRPVGGLPQDGIDGLIAGLGGMGVVGLTWRIATLLRTRCGRVYTKESRGFAQRRASLRSLISCCTK